MKEDLLEQSPGCLESYLTSLRRELGGQRLARAEEAAKLEPGPLCLLSLGRDLSKAEDTTKILSSSNFIILLVTSERSMNIKGTFTNAFNTSIFCLLNVFFVTVLT